MQIKMITISELDHITLHMGICVYMSHKPRYHIWRLAKKHKRLTKDPEVKKVMNAILRDVNPTDTVKSVVDKYLQVISNDK